MNTSEIKEIKEKYGKKLRLSCCEHHAHSYKCMSGNKKDILICELCDELMSIKTKILKIVE